MATAPVTQPLQEVLDAQHAFITAQAKELIDLRKQLADLAALIPKPINRAIKRAVEDLGCRPNDPSFDNFARLQQALDDRYGVLFDVGGLYYTQPLRTKPGSAAPILGSSAAFRHAAACMTGLAPFKPDQTHLLEISGVDGVAASGTSPAIPGGAGHLQTVRDLYFAGNATCDGLRIHGGDCVSVEACVFRQCKTGVLIRPTIRLYAPSLRNLSLSGCDVGIQIENGESVCCATVQATSINLGRLGFSAIGWNRGLSLTGVCCESQTEACFRFRDSRASLRSCYAEANDEVPGLWTRDSAVMLEDTHIRVQASHNSQVIPLGVNLISRTVAP